MRKMFNTLKSLVATAVMVSMLGTASLATSCVDEYDDTEIRNELSDIKGDLSKLEQRVSNLESKLNNEVATLKSMIDGLNVVIDAKKVGDDWKITLADGTEFTVYGPCDVVDTDTDTDVDTYLAPKKDTDGVFYWAIVNDTLGEDVTEEWLLVDGQKVPVFGGAECDCEPQEPCDCVAPELKFSVDEKTGNLLVSIDGGTNWVDSGIPADGACDCVPGEGGGDTTIVEECNCIIEDVDIWSKPGYVIFYLVGGSSFEVEIAQDGAGIIANIKGGRLNFSYGASKTAELDLKNVVDIAVMEKPEGWRAKIEGNKLNITAPAEEAVTSGAADAEGMIRLHATSEEGTCRIAKVKVSTNAGVEITVDEKTGEFVISNPLVAEREDWMSGMMIKDFAPFELGIAPMDEFMADPIAYIENLNDDWNAIHMVGNNLYEGAEYEEGVNETMVIEHNIAELYYYLTYQEIPEGEQFVVWVCPYDYTGYEYQAEDIAYGFYKPAVAKVEVLGASFCDVDVKIKISGAERYDYTVDVARNWIIADGSYDPVEMALSEWKTYKPMYESYGMDYTFGYGMSHEGEIDFEGSLAEFQTGGQYEADLLKPNTDYVLVVLPIVDGKAYDDYTTEDVMIWEFKTENIVEGGNSTITITPGDITYTALNASIDYSDDVVVAYWNFFDPETPEIVAGGQTMADYMLQKGNITTYFPTNATKTYGLAMGQTQTLAVMAVNGNGEYTIEKVDLTTKEMSYSTETAKIDAIEGLNNQIAVTLSVSGGNVVKYRVYPLASYNLGYYTEDDIRNTMLTNSDSYYSVSTVHVADGSVTGKTGTWDAATNTLTMGGVYNGTDYTVFVAAQFEDGSWTETLARAEVTPKLVVEPFYAASSDEAQAILTALGSPMIYDFSADGTLLEGNIKFENITDGMKVYLTYNSEAEFTTMAGTRDRDRASYLVDNCTKFTSGEDSMMFFINNNDNKLFYAVEDAEGNYYGTFSFDLGQVYDAMMGGGPSIDPGL